MGSLHDDIERYKKGELSSSEMHKLERKALDDPFLADALEGIDSMTANDLSLDLGQLRDRLKARTTNDVKVVSMGTWLMRIAAAVTILLIGTYLLTTLTKDKERKEIAMNKKVSPSSVPMADTIKVAPQAQDVTKDEAGEKIRETAVAPATETASPLKENATNTATRAAAEPANEENLIVLEDSSVDDLQGGVEEAKAEGDKSPGEIVELEAEPEPSARSEQRAKISQGYTPSPAVGASDVKKVIRGQVLDPEDGKGLPGVNVTIVGTNTGTVTDGEGFYEIVLNDINDGLQYSFIGFQNQEVVPGASNKVDVTLQPDYAQLSEVVVVGYGVAKDTLDGYPILEMASPKGGRKAYKQYLVSELRYPEQALENNVEGRVTVQFTVETSGTLSEFKVLKGIGHGCDEEVIRLIKEGPQWAASRRNTKAVRDRVRVRLKFALPKK